MVFYGLKEANSRFIFLRHRDVSLIIFTTLLSMLLLQQKKFNGVKITFFGTFKLRIKVTL